MTATASVGVVSASLAVRSSPAVAATVDASHPTLRQGTCGPASPAIPAVKELQRRLIYLRTLPGEVDGCFGQQVGQAVVAIQKLYRLPRDGVVGPPTWNVLLTAHPLTGVPSWGGGAQFAVDIKRQVMLFGQGGAFHIVSISSGNGQPYVLPSTHKVIIARTPTGRFNIQRQIAGPRIGELGLMYWPSYFIGGYAVHGSDSVPPYPASHGCVRYDLWLIRLIFPALKGASITIV